MAETRLSVHTHCMQCQTVWFLQGIISYGGAVRLSVRLSHAGIVLK